jgi:ketosteroid isomerase-like protein
MQRRSRERLAAAMSRGNVEIARRVFEAAFARPLDLETLNELISPDHEFHSLLDVVEGRSWTGLKGFKDFLAAADDALSYELVLEELTELDENRVLIATRTVGTGRVGGAPVDQLVWTVMTLRAGKLVSTTAYASREEAERS